MSATRPSTATRLAQRAWRLLHTDAGAAYELIERAWLRAEAEGDAVGLGWAQLLRGFHEESSVGCVVCMDMECATVGVERGQRTKWQRPLVIDVAERNTEQRRHGQRLRAFSDDILERARALVGVGIAIGEMPECESHAPAAPSPC